MQPGRGGCIINMSSVNAVMAIPTIAGYNASKGGVNNLTRQVMCYTSGNMLYTCIRIWIHVPGDTLYMTAFLLSKL